MSNKLKNSEITVGFAEQVWKGAQLFVNGVYVPTAEGEGHPCGWDFISFEGLEVSGDVENEPIEDYNISSGHGSDSYNDKTLFEILQKCHGMIAFEIDQIDW